MKIQLTIPFLFLSIHLIGQKPIIAEDIEKTNFEKYVASFPKDVYENKHFQRKKMYLERRLDADGNVPNITQLNHKAHTKYMKKHKEVLQKSAHGSWSFLGPRDTNNGARQGRVNRIDIHPTNDFIIYLSTPNGGIWKTTNGGSTWVPLTDHLALNSFADLEINPNNPDEIYALTGDGNPSLERRFHSQSEMTSIGLLKSEDGGVSWSLRPYVFPDTIAPIKLLMHPSNPNIQFVVAEKGIYKTDDGWLTGAKVYDQVIFDIEFKPGDPSIMYASGNTAIHRSTTSGDSWLQITDSDLAVFSTSDRIELAVTPDFPSYIVASGGNNGGGSQGVLYSYLNGINNSWVVKDTVTNIIQLQGGYNIALAIDPDNYRTMYSGGLGMFKSSNEGAPGSWSQTGFGELHEDVHDLVIKNGTIYAANDGGFGKSPDGGTTWYDLAADLGITEIYRISGLDSQPEKYIVGSQDNGVVVRFGGDVFDFLSPGDGGASIIDYANPSIVYMTRERGGAKKSFDGGMSITNMDVPGGNGAWMTPLIMDPVNHNVLFMAKDSVYRSLFAGATGSWFSIGSPISQPNVLVQSKSNTDRMFASRRHRLYRTSNARDPNPSNVSWDILGSGLPDHFITDIEVNPTNPDHVIVTLGNFVGGEKVYESTNAGNNYSWTNISGSLPNVPILTIAYHNDGSGLDRMYIGTDIGVFYRDDNLGDWIYYSNFLPVVPVVDLVINHTTGKIAAGTYGRGLWRSSLISNCDPSITFNSTVTSRGEIHYTYLSHINSQATISTEPGTSIFYKAGNYIDLKPDFIAPANSKFQAKIGPCP